MVSRSVAITPVSPVVGTFVRLLFSSLEDVGIRYCVLHGWEGLPWTVSSDLDLVVHPDDFQKLRIVFLKLATFGYRWIQCRNYAGYGYRFDFAWFEGKQFHIVGVDCISEYRYAGLILASGENLLKGRRLHNGFWIAAPDTVFAYLLMKKTLKGSISTSQLLELREISSDIGEARSLAIACETFGGENGPLVITAIADQRLQSMLPALRGQLRRNSLRRNPWSFVRYHGAEKLRLINRWIHPTGLFLIALGPDGVGKSTLLASVVDNLRPAFRGVYFFHYRATFSKKPGVPVENPHAREPRGPVLSAARALLLVFQFWVSYLAIVRPKLGRSGLVVFDRYFHDLLVDQRRYRYSGPKWLLRLLLKLIPTKDVLLLVLDADEAVIHARKQEVSLEQLRTLRNGYNQLAVNTKCASLIRTDNSVEDAVAQATEAVYEHLLRRWHSRCPQWAASESSPTRVSENISFEKAGRA